MRSAFLSGRLGRDPELHSPNGSDYSALNFSIANSDENKKKQDGSFESVTSWFEVVFWTKKPQDWLRKLHKGDNVIVECDAKQETWEKDGTAHSRIKFVVKFGSYPVVVPKTDTENNAPPAMDSKAPWEM